MGEGVGDGLIVGDSVMVTEPDGVVVGVLDGVEEVVLELLGEALGEEEAVEVTEGVGVGVECRPINASE